MWQLPFDALQGSWAAVDGRSFDSCCLCFADPIDGSVVSATLWDAIFWSHSFRGSGLGECRLFRASRILVAPIVWLRGPHLAQDLSCRVVSDGPGTLVPSLIASSAPVSLSTGTSAIFGGFTCAEPIGWGLSIRSARQYQTYDRGNSWECLARSLLLFYLLSCLHLLARLLPLRRGHERGNTCVRRVRRSLSGAPVLGALFFVAFLLPVVAAAPRSEGATGDLGLSSPVGTDGPDRTVRAGEVLDRDRPPPLFDPPPDGVETATDLTAAAAIHVYQRPTYFVKDWICQGDGVSLVVRIYQDCLFVDDGENVVLPVAPQPTADHVVLLAAPSWTLAQLVVPVLIQVGDGRQIRYVDYFRGGISCDDVRLSLGPHWICGGNVFVGDSVVPLADDTIASVAPGTLIIVERPGLRRAAVFSLEHKLEDPAFWFRDVSDHDLCNDFEPVGAIGVLGSLADWLHIRTRLDMPAQQVRRHIAAECGIRPDSFRVEAPPRPLCNVAFRGQPVTAIIGIVPRALDEASRIYIDARELAVPVRLILLPRLLTHLDRVLHLIGAERPGGRRILVQGCRSYDTDTETFIPEFSETIKIVVCPVEPRADAVQHGPLVEGQHGEDDYDEGSGRPGDFSAGNVEAGLHGPPGFVPDAVSAPVDGDLGHSSSGRMWNLSPFVDVAPCPCRSEDTSVEQVKLGDGVGQFDLKHEPCFRLSSDVVIPPAIVQCETGAIPRVDFAVDVFGRLPDGDDPPGEEESPEEEPCTSDEALMTEWCIQVCVLGFQTTPYTRTFWVAHGEAPSDLLVRLEILLAPVGSFYRLVIPDLQPPGRALQLLLVPGWWETVGRHAVLVVQPDVALPAYVEVVGRTDTIEDVLPLHSHLRDETVDLAVAGALRIADGEVTDVATGDTLFISGRELAAGQCQSSATMVADPSLHTQSRDVPARATAPTLRYALLGVAFEQNIIELRPGRVAVQVADLLRMTPNELILETQSQPLFDHVCIRGTPVYRCMSVRSDRYFRRGVGSMIFLDPRALGVPICCKNVFRLTVTPGDLTQMLDVQLPDGYAAHMRAGDVTAGPDVELSLSRNDSVVVWAVALRPATPPRLSAAEDAADDLSDPEDPSPSQDGATGSGPYGSGGRDTGRSRSPKRSGHDEGARHVSAGSNPLRLVPTPCRVGIVVPPLDAVGDCRTVPAQTRSALSQVEGPSRLDSNVPDSTLSLWKRDLVDHVLALHPPADTSGTVGGLEHCSCAVDDSWIGFGDLHTFTVLQESVVEVRSPFLAKVAGYLESRGFSEYTSDRARGSAVSPDVAGHGVVPSIRLYELLPPRTFDLTKQHFPVGRTLADVVDLLSVDPVPLSSQLPLGLDLHPSTRAALARLPVDLGSAPHGLVDAIDIFTDGSYDGTCSAWSFVAGSSQLLCDGLLGLSALTVNALNGWELSVMELYKQSTLLQLGRCSGCWSIDLL